MADYTIRPVALSAGLRYDYVRVPFRNRLDPTRDTTSTFRRLSPRGGLSLALGPSASLYVSAGRSFRAPALIELACALPRGLELGLSSRYTGARILRGDEANEESALTGHWLTDARVGYRVGGWETGLVVRNLLDVQYAAFGTFNINRGAGDMLERFLTPGTPRRLDLILRRQIGGRADSR